MYRYVEVMIKMDDKLTEHDKFYGGDAKEIRQRLIEQKHSAGGKGTPYCLGFNPTAHTSGYILFWLPGTKTCQEEKVKISVTGYKFREQLFQSPSRLINWFKSHAMDLINRQQAQQQQQVVKFHKSQLTTRFTTENDRRADFYEFLH